jgi:hypothetical protein
MIRSLEDREQIQKIVDFVDNQRSGWGSPWAGVPIPKVVANFYDRESFKGHFGVGPNFFETQREGDFACKDATTEQCLDFLRLISVMKGFWTTEIRFAEHQAHVPGPPARPSCRAEPKWRPRSRAATC